MNTEANKSPLTISRVDGSSGVRWIKQGWGLFKASPLQWALMIVIYIAIKLGLDLVPYAGSLIEMLLSPMLIAGVMLGCHQQVQEGRFSAVSLFAAFRRPVAILLMYAGLVMVLSSLVVQPAMWAMGSANEQGYGITQILGIILSCILFGLLLMATLFPPALLVFNLARSPTEAMKLSFKACYRNISVFLGYGMISLLLLFVAALPMMLGLLIVMPVLLASIYFAYQDLYQGA